jgi:hypothetical protein
MKFELTACREYLADCLGTDFKERTAYMLTCIYSGVLTWIDFGKRHRHVTFAILSMLLFIVPFIIHIYGGIFGFEVDLKHYGDLALETLGLFRCS